jgi:hypothetical protein
MPPQIVDPDAESTLVEVLDEEDDVVKIPRPD